MNQFTFFFFSPLFTESLGFLLQWPLTFHGDGGSCGCGSDPRHACRVVHSRISLGSDLWSYTNQFEGDEESKLTGSDDGGDGKDVGDGEDRVLGRGKRLCLCHSSWILVMLFLSEVNFGFAICGIRVFLM